jgi:hypothetical protein
VSLFVGQWQWQQSIDHVGMGDQWWGNVYSMFYSKMFSECQTEVQINE